MAGIPKNERVEVNLDYGQNWAMLFFTLFLVLTLYCKPARYLSWCLLGAVVIDNLK